MPDPDKTPEQIAADEAKVKAEADAKAAADAEAKAAADAKAQADAKAADDARAFLADFVSDPQNLASVPNDEILKLHEKVKTNLEKKVAGQVPEWAQKRIDQLTAVRREAERQRDALRAENEQLKAGKQPTVSEEELNARAAALASARTFDEACGKVLAEGRKAVPDFDKAVAQLHQISPALSAQGVPNMPRTFVEALIEVPEAPRVIAELAKPEHNDEAARIMAMPPAKQGVALAQFASRLSPKVEISKAPPPPATLVNGRPRGEPSLDDPNVSMADWVKLRNNDLDAKRKAGMRV